MPYNFFFKIASYVFEMQEISDQDYIKQNVSCFAKQKENLKKLLLTADIDWNKRVHLNGMPNTVTKYH